MSAIAAVWHRHGAPLGAGDIDGMLDRQRHRGPDGAAAWVRRSVAIGHASLELAPESMGERLPLVDGSGRYVLAFDGRIDNRDDLLATLQDEAGVNRRSSDAALVLAAFARWRHDTPARLLGDFAFLVWDELERTLFGARDQLGIRPFCYRDDGWRFAAASELQALVAPPFDRPDPNEGMIGEVLAGAVTSTSETLFAGVYRLPPAHQLVVSQDAVRASCYWTPRIAISRRSSDALDEEFRALFRESVRCRLRTPAAAGLLLSGGLDSASVAGMAASLVRAGAVPVREVRTYSAVYPGHPSDERPAMEAIVGMWDLTATFEEWPSATPQVGEAERYCDLPTPANAASVDGLRQRAHRDGVRLMLTGLGPDEWLSSSRALYADLLRRGRFVTLGRQLALDARMSDFPGWPAAAKEALWPLAPDVVRRSVRHILARRRWPDWIRPEFAHRIALADRFRAGQTRVGLGSLTRDETWREAMSGENVLGREQNDRIMAASGLEHAHPLEDRRIVEFGLSLPDRELWYDGEPKRLFRRAVRPLVPECLHVRCESPDYSHVFARAIVALDARSRFAAAPSICDDWFDTRAVAAACRAPLDGTPGDPSAARFVWAGWSALMIALWAGPACRGIRAIPSTHEAERHTADSPQASGVFKRRLG